MKVAWKLAESEVISPMSRVTHLSSGLPTTAIYDQFISNLATCHLYNTWSIHDMEIHRCLLRSSDGPSVRAHWRHLVHTVKRMCVAAESRRRVDREPFEGHSLCSKIRHFLGNILFGGDTNYLCCIAINHWI